MDENSGENIRQPTNMNQCDREFGYLSVLDDLICLRAADAIQSPIFAYPRPGDCETSYDYYTGRDLNDLINQAIKMLMDDGFQSPDSDDLIVALLTLSDFNMIVTFFALSRMGYTVMMISPRLSSSACVSLLESVGCETVLHGQTSSIRAKVSDILRQKRFNCHPMRSLSDNESEVRPMYSRRNSDPDQVALILHSSGSTGPPKPLFLSHRAIMTHPPRGPGLTAFSPLPWYHLHGLSTALQAMYKRKTLYMWNAALPLTAKSIISALNEAKPELVAAVPYVLQLMVGNLEGITALRNCKLVTYGGAPCPDELGDRLMQHGVRFGGSFGLTEAGLVADSISRPKGDPFWNFLQFFENLRPYIWMKPISETGQLFECVYLTGHPALTESNSNEPPGSFHSKDVFIPHPTIPDRWKYISRLDDRITLINGEKILPLAIEGQVKQHPLVYEAVVVGAEKAAPGLLLWRTEDALYERISDAAYLQEVWPSIKEVNSKVEGFSHISHDMVLIFSHFANIPRTDKGSIIRAQVYKEYAKQIEALYDKFVEGDLLLDFAETQSRLLHLCREEVGIQISSVEAKFYTEGVDSLKSIQLRRLILQHFKFAKDRSPSQNVVFETGSISQLARHICSLQGGWKISAVENDASTMSEWIEKYSQFRRHLPLLEDLPGSRGVLLTGATGSIGAHILFQLLNDESISKVFCFTRRSSPLDAVLDSLAQRGLCASKKQMSKIVALDSDLDKKGFGLKQEENIIGHLQDWVTLIIHTAWPVNFSLPLPHFEPHIQGLFNLIEFSLSVRRPEPAVVIFCSSISTALRAPTTSIKEEVLSMNCPFMGYGQSKLVGEHIVSRARQSGAKAFSLRIGQVSGHSVQGMWNDTEALPLMLRSALTLKALPELNETCSWIPVDILTSIVLDIAKECSVPGREYGEDCAYTPSEVAYMDDSIYNVCNSHGFSWSLLLATLKQAGMRFDIVPFSEWLDLLRESEARGEEQVNPAIKLIHYYEAMYGAGSSCRGQTPKMFVTHQAERDSDTLRNGCMSINWDEILKRYAAKWVTC